MLVEEQNVSLVYDPECKQMGESRGMVNIVYQEIASI